MAELEAPPPSVEAPSSFIYDTPLTFDTPPSAFDYSTPLTIETPPSPFGYTTPVTIETAPSAFDYSTPLTIETPPSSFHYEQSTITTPPEMFSYDTPKTITTPPSPFPYPQTPPWPTYQEPSSKLLESAEFMDAIAAKTGVSPRDLEREAIQYMTPPDVLLTPPSFLSPLSAVSTPISMASPLSRIEETPVAPISPQHIDTTPVARQRTLPPPRRLISPDMPVIKLTPPGFAEVDERFKKILDKEEDERLSIYMHPRDRILKLMERAPKYEVVRIPGKTEFSPGEFVAVEIPKEPPCLEEEEFPDELLPVDRDVELGDLAYALYIPTKQEEREMEEAERRRKPVRSMHIPTPPPPKPFLPDASPIGRTSLSPSEMGFKWLDNYMPFEQQVAGQVRTGYRPKAHRPPQSRPSRKMTTKSTIRRSPVQHTKEAIPPEKVIKTKGARRPISKRPVPSRKPSIEPVKKVVPRSRSVKKIPRKTPSLPTLTTAASARRIVAEAKEATKARVFRGRTAKLSSETNIIKIKTPGKQVILKETSRHDVTEPEKRIKKTTEPSAVKIGEVKRPKIVKPLQQKSTTKQSKPLKPPELPKSLKAKPTVSATSMSARKSVSTPRVQRPPKVPTTVKAPQVQVPLKSSSIAAARKPQVVKSLPRVTPKTARGPPADIKSGPVQMQRTRLSKTPATAFQRKGEIIPRKLPITQTPAITSKTSVALSCPKTRITTTKTTGPTPAPQRVIKRIVPGVPSSIPSSKMPPPQSGRRFQTPQPVAPTSRRIPAPTIPTISSVPKPSVRTSKKSQPQVLRTTPGIREIPKPQDTTGVLSGIQRKLSFGLSPAAVQQIPQRVSPVLPTIPASPRSPISPTIPASPRSPISHVSPTFADISVSPSVLMLPSEATPPRESPQFPQETIDRMPLRSPLRTIRESPEFSSPSASQRRPPSRITCPSITPPGVSPAITAGPASMIPSQQMVSPPRSAGLTPGAQLPALSTPRQIPLPATILSKPQQRSVSRPTGYSRIAVPPIISSSGIDVCEDVSAPRPRTPRASISPVIQQRPKIVQPIRSTGAIPKSIPPPPSRLSGPPSRVAQPIVSKPVIAGRRPPKLTSQQMPLTRRPTGPSTIAPRQQVQKMQRRKSPTDGITSTLYPSQLPVNTGPIQQTLTPQQMSTIRRPTGPSAIAPRQQVQKMQRRKSPTDGITSTLHPSRLPVDQTTSIQRMENVALGQGKVVGKSSTIQIQQNRPTGSRTMMRQNVAKSKEDGRSSRKERQFCISEDNYKGPYQS